MNALRAALAVTAALLVRNAAPDDNFGAYVQPSRGGVVPKPQHHFNFQGFYVLFPDFFKFTARNNTCKLLSDSFTRYKELIRSTARSPSGSKSFIFDPEFRGFITGLDVSLNNPCSDHDYPSASMDENYTMYVVGGFSTLHASSIWGVLRGLESFSQLVHLYEDERTLVVNQTLIMDFPSYSFRSLLVDTSRHFIPLDSIYSTLDAMSYHKLNVFHWHVTDDESFPFLSKKFPELSKGAFNRGRIAYSVEDMKKVVEYARTRAIRVVPEFNTPAHSKSWGIGMKRLLCVDTITGALGPINPALPETYRVLEEFFAEIFEIFPDETVHIGGEEIDTACWRNSPEIQAFMESRNITGDYDALVKYYVEQLVGIFRKNGKEPIVRAANWNQKLEVPDQAVLDIWEVLTVPDYVNSTTRRGGTAVVSGCWMMPNLQTKGAWLLFYYCRPRDGLGEEQAKLVLGGEAVLYTQNINAFNILTESWPKASGVAERLWRDESRDTHTVKDITARVEEHVCRLIKRKVYASPSIGPDICI